MSTIPTTIRPTDGTTFTGWIRLRGQRWKPVVTATTEGEATTRLLAYSDGLGHCDLTTLPGGTDPNRSPARVARKTTQGRTASFQFLDADGGGEAAPAEEPCR